MPKKIPLSIKLTFAPSVAILGLILFVGYTSAQLSETDHRLVNLETYGYPALELTDRIVFEFSRVPGLLNNAVAAGERSTLGEAKEVLSSVRVNHQALEVLVVDKTRRDQLKAWMNAVAVYGQNAIDVSEKLVVGNASFDDLRPKNKSYGC